MKRFIVLFIFFLVLIPSSIFAQTYNKKEVVVLSADTTINENYFAFGEAVTILGTVNGDAYIGGGNVLINGAVNGDLLIAGGSVSIDGIVTGDVRAAGGTVHITGNVDGNITVLGGTVTIAKDAIVGKGLVAGAGQLSVFAPIKGGVTIGAGNAMLGNTISGNVLASVGQLTLTPTSAIQGNLIYYSDNKVLLQPGTAISGRVDYRKIPIEKKEIGKKTKQVRNLINSFSLLYKIYSAVVGFIIGVFLSLLFPNFLRKTVAVIDEQSLLTMGVGILALIGLPVVFTILIITIIGIPIALGGFAIYLIYIYLAKVFVALYVGKKIAERFKWSDSLALHLFIGLTVLVVATNIPFIGWFVQFAVIIAGVGAILLTKKYYLQTLRSKKLL